jgi:N-terminal domain of ribose phosphate pyrophosphokinase
VFRTWEPVHSAAKRLRLFALNGTEVLGEKIARSLGCHRAALEERSFEDGEHKVRPLKTVAGCDFYVVHSLHGGPEESPNDNRTSFDADQGKFLADTIANLRREVDALICLETPELFGAIGYFYLTFGR